MTIQTITIFLKENNLFKKKKIENPEINMKWYKSY